MDMSLQHEPPEVKTDAPVTLRLARPADIGGICRMYSSDPWLYIGDPSPSPDDIERTRGLYLDRLERGELCYLAIIGGAIAHVNWTCFSWGDALPEHPVRLQPGEIYTTDAITPPAYRGRNLHAFVLHTMLARARERGIRRAYTLARYDRTDVFGGLHQAGYRECGRIVYFLPKGRTKAWILWRRGNLDPLFRP